MCFVGPSLILLTIHATVALRHEVLTWLLPRRHALKYLISDLNSDDISTPDFTPKELALIRGTLEDNPGAYLFWACAFLCSELAAWGAEVSSFFHSCPLSSHGHCLGEKSCKNCQWKGRMSVKLAQGSWIDTYAQQLLNLGVAQAKSFLEKLDDPKREELMLDFHNCKLSMTQRFQQVFSYWRELPWRICAVGVHLFYVSEDAEIGAQYIEVSKHFAREILEQWNEWNSLRGHPTGHQAFHMPRKFLDPNYPSNLSAYMVYWASSADPLMPPQLSMELMKYCSALTAMQSLEAAHHFINLRVSYGRASLPASTCAYLRRRTNKDVYSPRFRKDVARLIGNLSSILPTTFEKRSETLWQGPGRAGPALRLLLVIFSTANPNKS